MQTHQGNGLKKIVFSKLKNMFSNHLFNFFNILIYYKFKFKEFHLLKIVINV